MQRKGYFKKIAIVTPHYSGPTHNSGVGSSCAALAEHLAQEGHSVDVLFASGESDEDESFHYWQLENLRKNIRLESIHEAGTLVVSSLPVRKAYAVYLILKERQYDIIHFQDTGGLGYFCFMAKEQGLSFLRTTLCVTLHGPREWVLEATGMKPLSEKLLFEMDAEKKSIELADVLISPSQHILNWIIRRKWKIPSETYVEPNLVTVRKFGRKKSPDFNHLIFFGRLETRKGIELFCDSLKLLPRAIQERLRISFLGMPGQVGASTAEDYLSQNLKLDHRIFPNFNQTEAFEYIQRSGGLVVIPSLEESLGLTVLECLELGVPFVASSIPAFKESILPKFHRQILFEKDPRSLAEKLSELMSKKSLSTPCRRLKEEIVRRNFSKWHSKHVPRVRAVSPQGKSEKVSVCLIHKDRPEFLSQALQSIREQAYENLEVILVDDGSSSKESRAYLGSLQKEFQLKNWTLHLSKRSLGPIRARNQAARLSHGKYLLFMDDDNIAYANEVDTFLRVAKVTSADVVTCSYDRFSANEIQDRILAYTTDLKQCLFSNPIGDTNSLFRKTVFLKLGGFRPPVGGEDFKLLVRAITARYKVRTCPEALFKYRLHEGNISRKVAVKTQGPEGFLRLVKPTRTNVFDTNGELRPCVFRLDSVTFKKCRAIASKLEKLERGKFLIELDSSRSVLQIPVKLSPQSILEFDFLSLRQGALRICQQRIEVRAGLNKVRLKILNAEKVELTPISNGNISMTLKILRLEVYNEEA